MIAVKALPAMALPRNTRAPTDVLLTFLESVGRRADAEFYLKLFRQLPKESFAVVVTEAELLEQIGGAVAEQLRFLKALGLVAPVVVGLFDPSIADSAASALADRIPDANPSVHSSADRALPTQLRTELGAGRLPVISLGASRDWTLAERFDWLARLAAHLATRKVVVLRRQGGLGPSTGAHLSLGDNHYLTTHEGGISVINLTTDYERLMNSGWLPSSDDRRLLECLQAVLTHPGCERAIASVASPLTLLSELFTVKGAGTLVKQGTRITRHPNYDGLSRDRLRALIASSFHKTVSDAFFLRPPHAVYLEESYRGTAIVEDTAQGPFLTKFAVERAAQGEGVGRDLWQALSRDLASVYWRARPDNPIGPWYASLCDGMSKSDRWVVYWCGIAPERIPGVISEAHARTDDFI